MRRVFFVCFVLCHANVFPRFFNICGRKTPQHALFCVTLRHCPFATRLDGVSLFSCRFVSKCSHCSRQKCSFSTGLDGFTFFFASYCLKCSCWNRPGGFRFVPAMEKEHQGDLEPSEITIKFALCTKSSLHSASDWFNVEKHLCFLCVISCLKMFLYDSA